LDFATQQTNYPTLQEKGKKTNFRKVVIDITYSKFLVKLVQERQNNPCKAGL
jgi:hypothetical protein